MNMHLELRLDRTLPSLMKDCVDIVYAATQQTVRLQTAHGDPDKRSSFQIS